MKLLTIILILLFASVASACLTWDAPTVDFEGNPLPAPVEEYVVYVGDTNDPATMAEVVRVPAPQTFTGGACSDIGLTPHRWVCVRAAYAQGISDCALVERLPPGKAQNVKVTK